MIPSFQEKPLSFSLRVTVPQTDTGGLVENTKALERTQEKELLKSTTERKEIWNAERVRVFFQAAQLVCILVLLIMR